MMFFGRRSKRGKYTEGAGKDRRARRRLPVLSALVLVAFLAGNPPAFAQPGALPQHLRAPLEAASPERRNEVVAAIGGEEITREILYWYNLFCEKSGFTPADVLNLPPRDLRKLVEDAAVTRMAARRAKADSGLGHTDRNLAEEQRDELLIPLLEEREVNAKIGEIVPDEIRSCYEQNTEAFKTPFTFSIRNIFVSNYQAVETKVGDTLEELARSISGDPNKADFILIDDNAKSPRAPGYSRGDRSIFKPLEPGEHLLVPISEEARREKRKKIEAARKRLQAGDNFTSVALQYSENTARGEAIHGADQAGKPVLAEVIRNLKTTPEGKFTNIFETKHGYNIMQVVRKTDERVHSLEEAEPAIRNYLRSEKRRRALDDYTRALYRIPELKIEMERLKDPETPMDAVVVTLGDKTYARKEFVLKSLGETSKDMRDEDIMPLVLANSDVRTKLRAFQARKLGLDKSGEYVGKVLGLSEKSLRESYLAAVRKRLEMENISPEDAKKFFENHRGDYILLPYFTFYVLALKVEEPDNPEKVREAQTRARELVLPVKTLDQFKRVIEEHGEQFPGMREKGLVENAAETDIGPDLLAALRSLKTEEMAPPLFDKPHVMVPWLVNRTMSRQATYEEVEPRLPAMVRERKLQLFPGSEIEKLLKEANVVIR